MKKVHGLTALVCGLAITLSSGCATLAHRNRPTDSRMHCDGGGEYCPWLIGDALLLIPGIVPGVIAFIVDFGTGEWRHSTGTAANVTEADTVASR